MEILIVIGVLIVCWSIYEYIYFNSEEFKGIKESIKNHTHKCNELNSHIEKLKSAYINIKKMDYGQANFRDNSIYNFKRNYWKKISNQGNVHNCSLSVCRNANQQPFKYICKYFNIKANEESLENFEDILNKFSTVEEGKYLLKNERDKIVDSISDKIPLLIRFIRKNQLIKKLGFKNIDMSQLYFPSFKFQYVSAGGNSSMSTQIVFNIENLNKFIIYLSEIIKFRKSVAGQRALMTTKLREKIKSRDKYTCKSCGLSIYDELNLLLEIDHIIPLSKGGLTEENNLQVLCWRCNRSKGNKITIENSMVQHNSG